MPPTLAHAAASRAAAALALACWWGAAASGERVFSCTSRTVGCSRHGECVAGTCLCDAYYEGETCDIWRAPPRPKLLQGIEWVNCTHGRRNKSAAVVEHCGMRNKTVCEAAGAPTVPQTCANEDMFLICDYTGCYSKPFCEGFTPPGTTPPGRNPQPYHCFCPNGPKEQTTTSRPITIPGIPGTICAPPCDSSGKCCESYQRDHRFQTPLPILAKPQCVVADASASPPDDPEAKCRGSMCVLTCDPTTNLRCGTGPDHRPLDPGKRPTILLCGAAISDDS